MRLKNYDRQKAFDYAQKWSFKRNPEYYNLDNVGGDCTSFASQVLFSGSGIMNYEPLGWYYCSGNDKSASWSSVEYLHKFLTTNIKVGPFGKDSDFTELEAGDLIQLSFDGTTFSHTLVVVNQTPIKSLNDIVVATHTFDAFNKPLTSYYYKKIRFIKIQGVRTWH